MSITNNHVSVIIINHNSTKKLNKLVESLKKIDKIIGEIIIIDNNSDDLNKLSLKYSKAKLVQNNTNIGFSRAINQGIDISNHEILLLLNPDCLITDNSPQITYNAILKNHSIGMAGGAIYYMDSFKKHYTATTKPNFLTGLFEFTNIKKIFPNNFASKKFWLEKCAVPSTTHVFSLCGAYLFLRKHCNKRINYFDERFFLYLEDLDLGYRIEENGQLAIFDPRSHIKHLGGGSSDSKYHIELNYWYDSRKKFFLKHLPKYQGGFLYIIFCIEEFILKIYHQISKTPNA